MKILSLNSINTNLVYRKNKKNKELQEQNAKINYTPLNKFHFSSNLINFRGVETVDEISKKYHLEPWQIYDFINKGYISILQDSVDVLIDTDDKNNKNVIEKFSPKKTDIYDKLNQPSKEPVYADIYELAQMGIASKRELFYAQENYLLRGNFFYKKLPNGEKIRDYQYDLNDKNTQNALKKIRSRKLASIDSIPSLYGIDRTYLEKAIIDGRIKLKNAIFSDDIEKQEIDITNPKNNEEFKKLILISYAHKELIKKTPQSVKTLSMKLTWRYMSLEDYIKAIPVSKTKLRPALEEKYNAEKAFEDDRLMFKNSKKHYLASDLEAYKRLKLSQESIDIINEFDTKFISNASIGLFDIAITRAVGLERKYKKAGIDNISETEGKSVLLNALKNDY